MFEKVEQCFKKSICCNVLTITGTVVKTFKRLQMMFNFLYFILSRNILLNYAVANPTMGYTQGMSDLLAPVLAEIQNEADAYWCFTGLMQGTIFVSSPRDSDMDKQLVLSPK